MVSTVLDLVSAPGVLYATVLVLLTVDAFIPVVPAQALMIGGGILSASGHVQLLLLVLSGAAGVVAGDLLAFLVGRRLARRDARKLLAGDRPNEAASTPRKTRAITRRLNETMRKHIFLAVLFCRFVPAGRMITAVYAGRNGVSTRRFASYDVVAATLWASYGALLGHFGGEAIASSSWLPLALVAAAAVLFVAAGPLIGLAGKLRKRTAAAGVEAGAATAVRSAPRICRRRTAMETLAAAEPMAAIEVLVAAEAVAAAESVVVQVNGLQATTS